jgi:hypothetical protein
MANYNDYITYINSIVDEDITDMNFKNNNKYTLVLENLTKTYGSEYLKKIEEDFPNITYEDLKEYINLNDKYGSSIKTIFTTKNMKLLYCSPTCIRYIYHALLILSYLKKINCKKVIEVGAGYGGLFLAINVYAPKLEVDIEQYYIVDLKEVIPLIKKNLLAHKKSISISLELYSNENYGEYIKDTDALFISNYCFTAISENERKKYTDTLVKNSPYGFIVWQTCFGLSIDNTDTILNKTVQLKEEETPQTANPCHKNYYVLW